MSVYKKKGLNPNMGRPTTNPKTIRLEIRLSEPENALLEECVNKTGRTKSEIIIKGIALVNKEINK